VALYHFSVTQLRTAATCPRIHYFDFERARREGRATPRPTLVWLPGEEARAGGGALFHRIVEKFNRRAAHAPEIDRALVESEGAEQLRQAFLRYVNTQCIDLKKLATRSVPLRQALTGTLQAYFTELAEMVNYALSRDASPSQVKEQIFGDRRQRVDVTFRVGDGDEAHVTGAVDYVFYDWRISGHRIIDYKLLPADHQNKDLFQVFTYALMHHHQHGTKPSACVFYLYPKKKMVERKWDAVFKDRHKVYTHLASMVGWAKYDEATGSGLKPKGNPIWCAGCKWNRGGECERRLGPKHEGAYDTRWEELGAKSKLLLEAEVHTPSAPPEAEEAREDAELEAELDEIDPPREPSGSNKGSRPLPRVNPEAQEPAGGAPRAPARSPEPKPTSEGMIPDGLYLGRLGKEARPVVIPVNAIKTHVAVVGAAGSGKTWAAKCLVEEVVRAGVPVLAIDPQGDLVQFLHAREADAFSDSDRKRYDEYVSKVEPRIFTPGTSHGERLSLDPIRLPSDADLARIEKPERREEERDSMLQAIAGNLVSLASIGGEEDSQRTLLYLILERLRSSATLALSDVVSAILAADELGLPHEPDQILKKSEREKLARKLTAFVVGPGKNLFSGGTALDLERFVTPRTPGKVPLNVIYLNALTDDDQKHFFLAALASEIYRWMVTTLDATSGRSNLLFYIDEARDYIPAGGRKPAAKEPLIRLFTQGRKYGVGCLLCTQSPRSVDYNVFGNCSTKIVGRMEAEQDVERIADWFTTSGPRPDWVPARKGAEKGTFVARSPDMPAWLEGQAFTSRLLYSMHEGAWSPDRVEREVDALARG
jgi:DNA helicase HerA-like ATPase